MGGRLAMPWAVRDRTYRRVGVRGFRFAAHTGLVSGNREAPA
jgi:hypothetical protein